MTAPDPLSNTSAIVASEVSLPENVFFLFIYLIQALQTITSLVLSQSIWHKVN